MAKTIITVSHVEAYEEEFTLPVAGDQVPIEDLPDDVQIDVELPMIPVEEDEEMNFASGVLFGSRDTGRYHIDGLSVQGPDDFVAAWSLQNGVAGFDLSYLHDQFTPAGTTDLVYPEDLNHIQGGNVDAIDVIIPHTLFQMLICVYNDPDWRSDYMSGWSVRTSPYNISASTDKMFFVNEVYEGGSTDDDKHVFPPTSHYIGGQPCVAYDNTSSKALFGAVLGYVMFTSDDADEGARVGTLFRVFDEFTLTDGDFTDTSWELDDDHSINGTWYRVPYIFDPADLQATTW